MTYKNKFERKRSINFRIVLLNLFFFGQKFFLAFSRDILALLTHFPMKYFALFSFEVWRVFRCTNCDLGIPIRTYVLNFTWVKFYLLGFLAWWEVQTCTEDRFYQLKLMLASFTWSREFFWRWFLVYKVPASNNTVS